MNSTLEEVSTCLYRGRVPICWSKLSPPTAVESLAHYVEHLMKRTLQYSNWVNTHVTRQQFCMNKTLIGKRTSRVSASRTLNSKACKWKGVQRKKTPQKIKMLGYLIF